MVNSEASYVIFYSGLGFEAYPYVLQVLGNLEVINRLRAKFGKPQLEPPPAQAAKGR